jgi:hypothetical protein
MMAIGARRVDPDLSPPLPSPFCAVASLALPDGIRPQQPWLPRDYGRQGTFHARPAKQEEWRSRKIVADQPHAPGRFRGQTSCGGTSPSCQVHSSVSAAYRGRVRPKVSGRKIPFPGFALVGPPEEVRPRPFRSLLRPRSLLAPGKALIALKAADCPNPIVAGSRPASGEVCFSRSVHPLPIAQPAHRRDRPHVRGVSKGRQEAMRFPRAGRPV